MQNIITGYYIETDNIIELEKVLDKMRKKIKNIATKEYNKLLSLEIESLVDYISLGSVNRPDNILEAARNELANRIGYSSYKQDSSRYNFNVSVNIMFYEGKTFLKFNANNNIYSEALEKIGSLHSYHFNECDINNEKGMTWKKIMDKYEINMPMCIQLLKGIMPEVEFDKLKFTPKDERIEKIATQNMITKLLNMYGREQQIPSYCLMDYFAYAVEDVENHKQEISNMKKELSRIIVDITEDIMQVNQPADINGESD